MTEAPEPQPPSQASRGELRDELLIVLALSSLVWVSYALIAFAEDQLRLPDPMTRPVLVNRFPVGLDAFGFARTLVSRLFELTPVFLVAHFFARARTSMRSIGFDLTRLRFDVGLGVALALGAHAAAIASFLAAKALDVPYRPIIGVNADAPPAAAVLLLVGSLTAAVSEEVIVNAYLITRLKELGWRVGWSIGVSAVLRATYHLYQGAGGFVGNLVGGAIAGLVFVRTGRVMPLVIAHFLIDVIAFFGDFFFGEHLDWLR